MLVETPAGRLFVEVSGQGPDVVFWHSLLCDGGMWQAQIAALSPRYRCIVIDGPGHGRSAPLLRGFTLNDCVDAMVSVMDRVGTTKPIVCGLSWGGMVAMRLAVAHPGRVRGLALLATSARAERGWKKPGYMALAGIARTVGASPQLCKLIEPLFFAGDTRRHRPEVVAEFSRRLSCMDRASVGYACDAVIFDREDFSPSLGRIRVRTLVMVGDEDRATPVIEAEHIARLIPGARLVRVPGAGHLVAIDGAETVNDELERHFDAIVGSAIDEGSAHVS